MRLSKKLKRKIKSKVLGMLCIVAIAMSILAVDKINNKSNNLIAKIEYYAKNIGNIIKTSMYDTAESSETPLTLNEDGSDISVSKNALASDNITNPALSTRNTYIKIGETLDINVLDADTNTMLSDQGSFTWTSSNEDVATIDNNGIVTGKGIGHTTITGHNKNNGLKAKAIVNVYRNKEGAITVPQVEEGEGFTVVLKEDGTVWTAGYNNVGQLGDGTTTNRNTPAQVKIDEETYLTNVIKISSGYAHTAALTADGQVYAWGYNGAYNGKGSTLGLGDATNRLYATKVKGIDENSYIENIIDIACGDYTTYFVNKDGDTFGCGYNNYNEIDEKDINNRLYPTKMENMNDAIEIIAGTCNVAILKSNSEACIKGYNGYGAFGNNTKANIGGLYYIGSDINELILSEYSSYILKEDKTIWSSGRNNVGQLGLGDLTDRTIHTQIKLESGEEVKAKTIEAGGHNLLILGEDGKVYATGYNGYGQLCNGTTTNATYPIVIKNQDETEVTNEILLIAGHNYYSRNSRNIGIIRKDGTVWLSGDNTYGQLGNYSFISSNYLTRFGNAKFNVFIKDPVNVKETIECESIVQGVRDSDLADGNYIFRVTGETSNGTKETKDYVIELINYYDDVTYSLGDEETEKIISLGDNTTDYKMLVVKYHKNLTIDEGVTVTATNIDDLTYKKGMYLCVMGELNNKGTISMTARGTYDCEGENVYLWKNMDNTYEYVPSEGGEGRTRCK